MTNEFREKLLSLQWSTKGFETRDLKNYYDRESIDDLFGDTKDALDATDGLGAGWVGKDGEHYHMDRKTKEPVRTTAKEMDSIYLGGRTAEDG